MTVCLLSLADQCRSMRAPDLRCFDTECPMRLKKEHLDAECFRGHQ